MEHRTIFEVPSGGRFEAPAPDIPAVEPADALPDGYVRDDLPNVANRAEGEVVRHYTRLSQMNYAVDTGFYPLGSCTMKHNPKLGDAAAALPGFAGAHPLADEDALQGVLRLCRELEGYLCEICGMNAFTLWPAAGAHGELVGMMLFRAYHEANGGAERATVLIPDSAHGTNPASARMVGYNVRTVASTAEGLIDVAALDVALDESVAGIMITNPNTLGLFERDILTIAAKIHEAGGLLYYDGANLNAVMGRARPGDMGFDVVHLNLHKTFSTPHGGGGPGAGPVGVSERLVPYLPVPRVIEEGDTYKLYYDAPESIGRIRSFLGNVGVLIRAYAYIRRLGVEGLKEVTDIAVLNANYLRARVAEFMDVAGSAPCMHEFVATSGALGRGSALEIDKALIDAGFHPPTTYFPLIVPEALMVEPTETETRETLDAFADALREIMARLKEDPGAYKEAPTRAPVRRLDEVTASRNPVLTWAMVEDE
ncbi:MAG: aminomethyl-transferring glycine dehydrogenase subunit GcvPB [Candidatus Coatesbacteria bacterium]|nr:MAG: aminomethyl-transferring glycine dehydrogenase subunit GcvPB [Candidatus Coatesbacteria bacterium]